MNGYGGTTLRVDLGSGTIRKEKTSRSLAMEAIGGRGFNSTRMYEELNPACDPLSPENLLLIGTGPLTGSLLSSSAYTTISGKSPMTGIMGDSAAGGHFGPELKQAGYDQIIITGRSTKPCYLLIADDHVELRDATHLWGRDIWQSTAALRKELKDNAVQVAAIGPAGENLVKYATVACNNARTFGRTGMGCLFGSKQLKAIVVRGTGQVSIADPVRYLKLCKELDRRIMAHDEYQHRHELGSTLLMNALNGLGILPTNHFQEGICKYVDEVSGETLAKKYKTKNKACYNCNIHCSRYYVTPQVEAEGPEFETLCSYTTRVGSNNLEFALEMGAYLNRMGLDSLSSGETIGWTMECVQRGLLTKDDLDGMDFSWGNTDTIRTMVDLIIRREGIGELYAEGTRSLANHFGNGTLEYALQVKGLDIICGDPRGIKAFGLTYAIASRGADHLRAEPFFELTNRFDEAEKRFGTRDAGDRLSNNGKAALVEFTERQALLTDCMTMCKNIGLSMDIIDFDFAAELLAAGTGLPWNADKVNKALRFTIDKERIINIRIGVGPEEDTLPNRFTQDMLPEGPSKGQVVPVADMVKDYYVAKGWDENGVPPIYKG